MCITSNHKLLKANIQHKSYKLKNAPILQRIWTNFLELLTDYIKEKTTKLQRIRVFNGRMHKKTGSNSLTIIVIWAKNTS